MKYFKKIFILFISVLVPGFLLLAASAAYAMTPILSVSGTGNGDYVTVNVTGDPGTSVNLFAGSSMINLGALGSGGTGSFSVGSAQSENNITSIPSNSSVYVRTGGVNGTMSNQVAWPFFQTTITNNNLTLSQTALILNVGQTSTITASSSNLYLYSNSSPAIANFNFNGTTVTIQALTFGTTVAKICVVGVADTTDCPSISVTVQNSAAQQLTFSQNNFSIVSGQTSTVTVTGGSGIYTINNPNPTIIQSNLNGSAVALTAVANTGTDSITVCTTDNNNCGIINVSATTVNSSAITFSQTNPVVSLGQSATVTIYGGISGSNFYVQSNSSPSLVQANINSNILTLIANASTGTSTINICVYSGNCASLTATVSSASTGGALLLSQTAVSILEGQNSNITISGGSTPYSFSSSSSNIFTGVINGNVLTIYGVNPGSGSAQVCSSSGCTTLSVTITSTTTTSSNPPSFSQNNLLMNASQQLTIYVSGNGNFSISNNSNPSVASASVNGSAVIISAIASGSDSISVCQSGDGQCSILYLTVSGTGTNSTQLSLSQTSVSLIPGQSATVSIVGNGGYYIFGNSTTGVASAQISGSSVIVSAIASGTTTIAVCQTGGQCVNLYVTASAVPSANQQLALSQASLSLTAGQSTTVYITGNGSYYISSNSTTAVASAVISGSSVVVTGITAGSTVVSVCQSGGQCTNLSVTVTGTAPVAPVSIAASAAYVFPRYIGPGDKGDDVLQLQKFLAAQGYLTAAPNGYYGVGTKAAVKKYQQAHGINQTGNVGPSTLASLNQVSASAAGTTASSTTKAQQIASIQQALQQLLTQAAQMQGQ